MFLSFHFFFLMGDCFDILFLFFKIQLLKVVDICSLHVIVWMTSPLFWPRMERHSLVKHGLPACPWKRHCIFFLLMWCAMMDDGCFAAVVPFFSLFMRKSAYLSLFLVIFQLQPLCFLLLVFIFAPFIIIFYVFNLVLKL